MWAGAGSDRFGEPRAGEGAIEPEMRIGGATIATEIAAGAFQPAAIGVESPTPAEPGLRPNLGL